MHPERIFDHVMCFGTFDIFHPGHRYYLSEAIKHGRKLTVVIARDARVENLKGRAPQDPEDIRLKNVQEAFPDAHVILGHESDIFTPLRELKPDVLVFGYDQRVPEDTLKELFPSIAIERIAGFEVEKWKSSKLRKRAE